MPLNPNKSDIEFRDHFENGDIAPGDFHHRDHLRLVFVYLCENDARHANERMRATLKKFLKINGVPNTKYHETLTYSWVQAVRHFMNKAGDVTSFDQFIAADDRLLDTGIMLSHYRRETLYSDRARIEFIPPDLQSIPQHP